MARGAIAELYDLFRDLDRRIASFDKKIDRVFHGNEDCQRIARIKGVGPKTATAIVAAIGDGSEFKNGRHLAAWVGLVPRQHSSGDRKVLMGISKRGNQHLRSLLVHGARAVVRTAAPFTRQMCRSARLSASLLGRRRSAQRPFWPASALRSSIAEPDDGACCKRDSRGRS